MFCRVVHLKTGWVLEIDPARIETDGASSFIRLSTMEPAFLATDLAGVFRADRFEKEAEPRHAQPDHN